MPTDPNDPFASEPGLSPRDVERLFDGETYDPQRDAARLLRQSAAVRAALLGSKSWLSTPEIRAAIGAEDNLAMDVTARVRDLRKVKHGNHRIESRPRSGHNGLWEYRHHPQCQCLGGDQYGEPKTPQVWFDALDCSHEKHGELMTWVRALLARGKCPKYGAPEPTEDELLEILDSV